MNENNLFTTYQFVYDDLKNKIIDEIFKPGEKLPSFSELCALYNVSNITVRKSIEMLRQNGYINSKPRIGNFVNVIKNEVYELKYNQKDSLKHEPTRIEIISSESVGTEEIEKYIRPYKLKKSKCAKIIRMHYSKQLPVMYEQIYILHHPKLDLEKFNKKRWITDSVSVINNYDVSKKMFLAVDNHCSEIKEKLFLDQEDSVFEIRVEYFTKQNRFAGLSISHVSCEDIKFNIS